MDSINKKNYKDIMDKLNVKQMILQGPPGTSKTYGAKEFLCEQAGIPTTNKDGKINEADLRGFQLTDTEYEKGFEPGKPKKLYWDIVQFHPSYGYEDFVRGITVSPSDTNNDTMNGTMTHKDAVTSEISINAPASGVKYETVNKILGKIAKVAECLMYEKDEKHDIPVYLIIDEINRANVSSVFGELIYALEYRDQEVATPYTVGGSDKIKLPRNLYIIGTMNTADRSIGNIDYAVRRRFLFFPMLPDKEIVNTYITDEKRKVKEEDKNIILNFFDIVAGLFNTNLNDDFNKDDVQVGHTLFLAKNAEEMELKFTYQILPILREYYKDGILVDNDNRNSNNADSKAPNELIMEYLKKFGKKGAISEEKLCDDLLPFLEKVNRDE